MHALRAQKRNPVRSEQNDFQSFTKELEQVIKTAANHETENIPLEFKLEPLIEPIPHHIAKAFYLLRYLKTRDKKVKIMNALNYMREIQKKLTLEMLELGSRDRINGENEKIYPNTN
jgi:hypothetical protein